MRPANRLALLCGLLLFVAIGLMLWLASALPKPRAKSDPPPAPEAAGPQNIHR